MKRTLLALSLSLASALSLTAQTEIGTNKTLFHLGDNAEWKNANFNDNGWKVSSLSGTELTANKTFAWYRIHFTMSKSILASSDYKREIAFSLGKADDVDQTYLNGHLIGATGQLPDNPKGYEGKWDKERIYRIPADSKYINWNGDNVIAIRVYNHTGNGGLYSSPFTVSCPGSIDFVTVKARHKEIKGQPYASFTLTNSSDKSMKGKVTFEYIDNNTGKTIKTKKASAKIGKKGSEELTLALGGDEVSRIRCTFSNGYSQKSSVYVPILTPPTPEKPEINCADRYGLRPGSPLIYRIPTSGVRPMRFTVTGLPEGVKLDAENGILSGKVNTQGEYTMTIKAENAKGSDERKFTLVVGQKIALTPPMGWNSWNCWGLSVSQEKVKSSAQAIIDKGLADFGYSYINIDDAWEAKERNADGTISPNEKFPDMKGLGEWLHSHGLKFGIYSSPGDRTCGNYLGTLDHEKQDAETYNSWGIDYLKYDWCGYSKVYEKEKDFTVSAYIHPYLKMEKYLRAQPRDIFYSLCQYGMGDVWRWGEFVDANSWRTTGDITDTWQSLKGIGFDLQKDLYPYSQPGHWNDPDMLIVGKVGWSSNLRDTRLTPDEQYTHISLWSLLASNLLIGCDVSQMDEFTKRLLCNREVIAVNQDILGRQAKPEVIDGDIQIWKRPLADGSYAVGIFNLGSSDTHVNFSSYFKPLGISSLRSVRDLWMQKDLSTSETDYYLPSHGVKYIKIRY